MKGRLHIPHAEYSIVTIDIAQTESLYLDLGFMTGPEVLAKRLFLSFKCT